MKCDNGCRIGYGCEVHDNTGDYWHRQFFAERARAERAEDELASAPDLDDLNYQLRSERALADRLAEALLREKTMHNLTCSPVVESLAAYEEARRPISTVTSTGDAE